MEPSHEHAARPEEVRLPWLVWPLICVVLCGHSTFAQEKHPTSRPHHQSFLWLDQDFRCDQALIAALGRLGISGTNVAGTAPSELQGAEGIPFYVDHLAGKGFLYLKDEDWEVLQAAWQADPDLKPLERPGSLRSALAIEAAKARLRKVLDQAADNHPVALSLDDEISIGRRNIPIDIGFEEPMISAFRSELRRRYSSPAELAKAWGCKEVPFDQVQPFSTQEIRRREFLKEMARQNFAPWAEYREFLDAEFARVVGELTRYARLRSHDLPIGFTGGEAPHPFSGVDWSRMLDIVDFCEPYDTGGSRELVRSFASPKTRIFRTLFESKDHLRANEQELWDYFLRGDSGVIIWSASRCFEAPDKLEATSWALRLAPVLRQVAAPELAAFATAHAPAARIAIVESAASNRAHWMLDSRGDGRNWIHRLSTFEQENSSQNLTREAWQKLLEDLHLDYRHIAARRLDRRSLAEIDVLILPRCIALSDQQAVILREFARRGTLIADCQLGLFDENLHYREKGLLDDLFGVAHRNRLVNLERGMPRLHHEGDPLGLDFAEPGLSTLPGVGATRRFGDVPAMIVRRSGPDETGRTVYLNLLVTRYLDDRLRGRGQALLEELRGVFRITGVRPVAELKSKSETRPPVRIFQRQDDRYDYLALLWNWRQSARALEAEELADLKSCRFELLLPRATLVEFITGQEDDRPGDNERPQRRSSLSITVDPFKPTIIRLERDPDDVRNR